MPVPVSQMWTVTSYVLRQKLAGRKQYPLVLMLEPLFRCNLACAGCGKIQYPAHVLKQNLSPEECFFAAGFYRPEPPALAKLRDAAASSSIDCKRS